MVQFRNARRKVRGCKWGMSHLHLCKDSQGKYPLSRGQEVAEMLSLIQSRKARSCPASQHPRQPRPPSLNLDCDDDSPPSLNRKETKYPSVSMHSRIILALCLHNIDTAFGCCKMSYLNLNRNNIITDIRKTTNAV